VHIAAIRDVTERHLTEKELERLAITDVLTGIFNRRYFFLEAEKIFERSNHPACDLAVLMIDIDHFKNVNDTYGHHVGDLVLREIAHQMRDSLRPTDLFARYGGEEFIALIPRMPFHDVSHIAERLVNAINSHPIQAEGHNIPVTISLGAAMLTGEATSLNEFLSKADFALYTAKQAGRNRWAAWEEPPSPAK